MGNNIFHILRVVLVVGIAFLSLGAGPTGDGIAQKAIKEAERLTIIENRIMACNVLYRNLKKVEKEDAKLLKEKLILLSRYFYSDKGFENYLLGKDLFDKMKFNDAVEKLNEANDLERDNVDVLHLLTLAQLGMQKPNLAIATNKKALQVCPIDSELLKDQLAVLIFQEKWPDALKLSDLLIKEYGDGSAQTLKDRAVALINLDHRYEAKKYLEQAIAKDLKFPEPYYWLATIKEKEPKEASKLLTKYVDLCKTKSSMHFQREPNLCLNSKEAERKMSL